jgi:TolB-like protein
MVSRRLAAILAADVVGFTRMIGVAEDATLARLRTIRTDIIEPEVSRRRGRVFKTTGDGFFCEFASVLDAVEAASAIQAAMRAWNARNPSDLPVLFRIGVHAGDVVADGDELFGDGVNIAARLEQAAESGGVCLSGDAYRQVKGKASGQFADLGPRRFRNLADTVHVYKHVVEGANSGPWTSTGKLVSERPSLVVLPFQNMSGDPEQDYFADGIVEDIITAISRAKWLGVIARNSAFTYKSKAIDIKAVGRELDVRYAVEGSVRRGGERLRITAQLIDAKTGEHIWADKFDGDMRDVFELQDRVTASIVAEVAAKVQGSEIERARRKPTESLDAYDLYLRALHKANALSAPNLEEAIGLCKQAIDLDPAYGAPYGVAAYSRALQYSLRAIVYGGPQAVEAIGFARAAIDIAGDDPLTISRAAVSLGYLSLDREYARSLAERAMTLDGGSAEVLRLAGMTMTFAGRFEQANELSLRALRLNPVDPQNFIVYAAMALNYFIAGKFVEADDWSDRTFHEQPGFEAIYLYKSASAALIGKIDEARETIRQYLKLQPDARIATVTVPSFPGYKAMVEGLTLAGLPA